MMVFDMATVLTINATEESTYVVTASFVDEDGVAMVPDTLEWILTDTSGTVINNRDGESVSPSSSVTIVLSGDDLALSDNLAAIRCLTLSGTYTSSLGANLPFTDECQFVVENITGV